MNIEKKRDFLAENFSYKELEFLLSALEEKKYKEKNNDTEIDNLLTIIRSAIWKKDVERYKNFKKKKSL